MVSAGGSLREASNRRRFARQSMDCLVQVQPIGSVQPDSPGCSSHCTCHDISDGGIGILADRAYPVKAQLLIVLQCEGRRQTHITSRIGSVVWAKPNSNGQNYRLGIEFRAG